jgi:uncharacterized protein YqfB (UPF0267 family)
MGILHIALQYSPWIHDYRIDHILKKHKPLTLESIRQKKEEEGYCVLKFIRNPFERTKSMYTHLLKKKKRVRIQGKYHEDVQTFQDFLLALKNACLERGHSDCNTDPHFCSQVYHQEHIHSDWTEVICIESIQYKYVRSYLKNVYNLSFDPSYTSDHWSKQKNNTITPQLKELIQEIYPRDCQLWSIHKKAHQQYKQRSGNKNRC